VIIGRTFTECKEVAFIKTNYQLLLGYGMQFPYHDSEIPQRNPQAYDARIMRPVENLPACSAKLVEVVAGNRQMEVMIINDNVNEVKLQQGAYVGTICVNNKTPQVDNDSAEKVNMGPMITETEVCLLLELLNSHRMCFAFNLKESGCIPTSNRCTL